MHISVYYIEMLHADDKRFIIKGFFFDEMFSQDRTGSGITESASRDHVAEKMESDIYTFLISHTF